MAKGKTEDPAPPQDDADLMAVVDATDPQAAAVTDAPSEPAPREKLADAPASPPPAPRGGSGAGAFFGMVLGGVVAAGAGFGLARAVPDLLPMGGQGELAATVAAQAEEIAALRADLAARPAPDPQIAERLAALEAAPAPTAPVPPALEERLAAVEAALADLQSRPSAGGAPAPELVAELDALKAQVATLSAGGSVPADVIAAAEAAEARLQEAQASAAALAAEAEAAAATARRNAAIGRITAALDSGAPYASALAELGGDAPPVLADNAAVGLPTVAELADSFPEVARAALEDALRANMGESWTDRVSNFLRSQTGLRSLTPREGNDPDAILSRAEAALAQGRVADAIGELDAMPEAGKPALSDWLAQARLRAEAEAAVATLAAN
ncbi:COG4223 family protein [Paragemmobacter ruber]|uniref:Inner membrane protein n=1 Tax=Paragemmobacter ruber TaxID=1985673 RepID=A0ABW9Y407_9RHOB|nr:mitofilin family membrane protein [Rhodobacter ruber]NBE07273.1 hypothetical protein [Rhodobacter ruber]